MYAENLFGLGFMPEQGETRQRKDNMKRLRSTHLGRVIDYHVMMYSSRYLKARSVFPILSILCVTPINYETIEFFREQSWSSGRCLANHKLLAGSSSRRTRVASLPSSLQARSWPVHRWCNMGNGRASRAQGALETVTRGFKKMETGFFKSEDRLPQGWRRAAPG